MNRRKELGITQEELAFKLGYKSKSTINKIELGINDIPQSKVVKFAEALKTTPAYIMGWEQEEKKNDTISDAVVKMRSDNNFFSLVECILNLNDAEISAVKQIISTLKK